MRTIATLLILSSMFTACDGWMNGHQRETLFIGVLSIDPPTGWVTFGIEFSGWSPTYTGKAVSRFYWEDNQVWWNNTTFQPGYHKAITTGAPLGMNWDYCLIRVEIVHDGRVYDASTDFKIVLQP